MVRNTVQERCCHLGAAKDAAPFFEREVCGKEN